MKMGRPQCVCSPDCSHVSKKHAVCGSDGVSYKDECALLMARCTGHPDLEVMYQGECKSKAARRRPLPGRAWTRLYLQRSCFPESCSNVVCPGTHTCVTDQTNSAHCVMCRTVPCPMPVQSEQPICGNDNITYPSACHLRRATCFLGRSIGVRHYGHCNSKAARRRSPPADRHRAFLLTSLFVRRSSSESPPLRSQRGELIVDGDDPVTSDPLHATHLYLLQEYML